MTSYLTFQLYGMLSAYGLVAVGEVRHSAAHPTRSAVLGLLAACLGIRRGEEARLTALSAGYGLAVRVDAPGTPLLDYHTIQTPPERKNRVYRTRADELGGMLGIDEEPYTILSRRGYLCDAHFTACLWAVATPPPHALEDLAQALRQPVLTPYLGRKCCPPSLPFAPLVGEFDGMQAALAAYTLDPDVFRPGRNRLETTLLFAEDAALAETNRQSLLVRDRTTNHGRRQFAERREAMVETASGRVRDREARHVPL
jgi:CRISPR system Cascade subunit CasD